MLAARRFVVRCSQKSLIDRYVKRGRQAAKKRKLETVIQQKEDELKALRAKLADIDEDDEDSP